MAANTTVNGPNTILTLTYEVETSKMTSILNDSLKWVYNKKNRHQVIENGEIKDYENLTGQEKLTILDSEIKYVLYQYAKQWYLNDEIESTRETAEQEAYNNYNF